MINQFIYSPEAAIALRQRLNETIEELDALRKKAAELEVLNDRLSRDLTVAKSDRTCAPATFAGSHLTSALL